MCGHNWYMLMQTEPIPASDEPFPLYFCLMTDVETVSLVSSLVMSASWYILWNVCLERYAPATSAGGFILIT